MCKSLRFHRAWTTIILVIWAAGCAVIPETTHRGEAVAVWDLENLTPSAPGMVNLGEALAAKIIETLKETGKVRVIERQRLILALEELNLGSSVLVDQETRLQIGKMVGARLMVFGAYQRIADTMRLDIRLVEVNTGKVIRAAKQLVSGSRVGPWLEAAQKAAKNLL
ncbi:MAG: hypothetical protein JRI36_02355 [Deltaproteobacteria bacterium]|nr:hypothetical protein [Deltaproteobacteria bacterium]